MMRTHDVRAWRTSLRNHHPIRFQVVAPSSIHSIALRAIEGREGQELDILQMMRVDIRGRLLHALAPIHIRIVEVVDAALRTAGDLVEVRNVVGKSSQRGAYLPCDKQQKE